MDADLLAELEEAEAAWAKLWRKLALAGDLACARCGCSTHVLSLDGELCNKCRAALAAGPAGDGQ